MKVYEFIEYMKLRGVNCVFHYIPLHTAPAGIKYGRFSGEDIYTTKESERLVRLPMWFGISESDREIVVKSIFDFFNVSEPK